MISCETVRHALNDITNSAALRAAAVSSPPLSEKHLGFSQAAGHIAADTANFNPVWSRTVIPQFLWLPLGPFNLEVSQQHARLVPVLRSNTNWTVSFIKDFGTSWKPGSSYEARATPKAPLDCVAQRLFLSSPSLHACIVIQGQGFLWLNRVDNEPFMRCTWLEDASASAAILPPMNLVFDIDETLIFNSEVKGAPVEHLDYVVKEPPHILKDDTDPESSDSPFLRPDICQFLQLICPHFRNVRMATFSVEARAKEIADNLDPMHIHLLRNYRVDPVTRQKPVANVVFARELLLQHGNCLSPEECHRINSGAIFWLKSLAMLDLPLKGLLQRSIIIDDRSDVWVDSNQDNIVKISGPDKAFNVGRQAYLNGLDGGELGRRILLSLINLELKFAQSPAHQANADSLPLCPPVVMPGTIIHLPAVPLRQSLRAPTRLVGIPDGQVCVRSSISHPLVPATSNGSSGTYKTLSPPTKTHRSASSTGFSHDRDRELKEKERGLKRVVRTKQGTPELVADIIPVHHSLALGGSRMLLSEKVSAAATSMAAPVPTVLAECC